MTDRKPLTPEQLQACKNVDRLLDEAGYSRTQAAAALGMTQPAITRYCTGKIPINMEFAIMVSNLTRRPLWEIDEDIYRRWKKAYNDNSGLSADMKKLESIDPKIRQQIADSIRMLISGALNESKPGDLGE